jgi:hypothetical protein
MPKAKNKERKTLRELYLGQSYKGYGNNYKISTFPPLPSFNKEICRNNSSKNTKNIVK